MARKMKDSGIEWIGEIPEGWSVSKVLHCLSMPITDGPHTTPILYDTGIPFVSAEAVSCGNGRIDFSHIRGYISEQFYKECCQKYVPEIDDIYMIKSGATTGRVAIVDTTRVFTIWSPLAVFRCNKDCMLPKFLYYYLQSPAFQKEVEFGWTFGTQQNVGMRSLEQMKVCVPQLNKQDTIANYLDYRCSQIDLLLQKALTSIEEYKKLKQAVITQAVTKGVRGEREMKDSGVDWIGEIPVDWEISRIKYVSIFEPSCDFRKLTPETIITYSPMECIKNGTFERRTSLYGNLAHTLTPFQNGDIVMAKVTPCFENGNIAIMNELQSGYGLGSSELFVFRPQNINTRYLFYWLQNKLFVHQACATMTGTGGLKRISPSFVKNCNIHYPSTAEQAEIADYLDAKCAEIDRLIVKEEQLVKELESYKKSLIYEVVTGKREV